jgi:hypothetical protein
MLIFINRRQAELNGLSGGSSLAMICGISAFLVGTVFLVSACLHWRFLRQTPSRAASQALVRPFHFGQTQPSHSNRPVVRIGISARAGKNERRKSRE